MYQESFGGRKTIPHSRSNHGAADNRPDVPTVEVKPIGESRFIPNGTRTSPTGLFEIKSAISEKGYVPTKGIQIVAFSRKPLTPVFETSHGGRRTGGGGTSKEALRRAKKKSRKNGK